MASPRAIPRSRAQVGDAREDYVGHALVGAMLGELVGATCGLGYQLSQAQGLLDTDRVFSIVILTGVVAAVILFLADRLERSLLKWRPQAQMN